MKFSLFLFGLIFSHSIANATTGPTLVPIKETIISNVHMANFKAAKTVEVSVQVPPNAYSLFVQIEGAENTKYAVVKIVDPDRKILVDGEGQTEPLELYHKLAEGTNPTAVPPTNQYSGALIPNGESAELKSGQWTISVRAIGEAPIQSERVAIKTLIRVLDPTEMQAAVGKLVGMLTLNLHFSGAAKLNSETYNSNANFRAFMKKLKTVMETGRIGIWVNVVDDVNIPLAPKLGGDSVTARNLEDILRASPGHTANGLNLYFVEASSPSAAGFSMGMPGIVTGEKQPYGIFVQMPSTEQVELDVPENLINAFRNSAILAAHEIGHYLGLFHVCSLDEKGQDQLSDTVCDRVGTNVMLPRRTSTNSPKFSASQTAIMLRHPLVKPYILD